jgi:hypothetical protein
MVDEKRNDAPARVGFTLEELDDFGTVSTLPFSLDHDIWKDRRYRPQILQAIKERQGG